MTPIFAHGSLRLYLLSLLAEGATNANLQHASREASELLCQLLLASEPGG